MEAFWIICHFTDIILDILYFIVSDFYIGWIRYLGIAILLLAPITFLIIGIIEAKESGAVGVCCAWFLYYTR